MRRANATRRKRRTISGQPAIPFPYQTQIATVLDGISPVSYTHLPCASSNLIDAILSSGIGFEDLENRLIDEAVKRAAGNLAGAARTCGITRPQLQYRLKKKDGF